MFECKIKKKSKPNIPQMFAKQNDASLYFGNEKTYTFFPIQAASCS